MAYPVSYDVLGGRHSLDVPTGNRRAALRLAWENAGTKVLQDKVAGDYQLRFNRGAPSQIVVYNFPFASSTNTLSV